MIVDSTARAAAPWRRRALTWAAGWVGSALIAQRAAAEPPAPASPYSLLDQVAHALVAIENQYVDVVDRERLLRGALKGMVAELDPHSAYLPADDFALLLQETQGKFAGVGVEVDFRNDRVTVLAAMPGSPAARAGVEPGDVLLRIDGQSTENRSADELIKTMRGPVGSAVTIDLRRPSEDRTLRMTLTRELIEIVTVQYKPLVDGLAYLRLRQFTERTHEEVLAAIARARTDRATRGLILDLRNNPGGRVASATAIADEFLRAGIIYSTRARGRIVDQVSASLFGSVQDIPLVVLVNEYTASAAELLAAALRDNGRGQLVGRRTFGKGSVQSILDLPNGSGLKLTTLRYYSPKGESIQVHGVAPDVEVPSGASQAEEPAVREAALPGRLGQAPLSRLAPAAPPSAVAPPARPGCSELPSAVTTASAGGSAQDIPSDPSRSEDQALSAAFQLLRDLTAPGTRGTP